MTRGDAKIDYRHHTLVCEGIQAFAQIESSQAKYDLTVTCGRRGSLPRFNPSEPIPKEIPWHFQGPKPDRDMRLRIDSDLAFVARFERRGHVNQGQVMPDSAQFENLLHSSRLVFSDVFPEEVAEVTTIYPAQFSRLCELVGPRQFQ